MDTPGSGLDCMSCRRATNRNKLDVCVLWASVAKVVRVLVVSQVRYHVLWFDGFQVFGQSRQQKAVRLDLECFDAESVASLLALINSSARIKVWITYSRN